MMSRVMLMVGSLIVVLLLAYTCTSAYGEVLPWDVERIRVYCVWDNNRDLTVDTGANAGQDVSVAIIDSGIDYWIDDQDHIHYHPDLEGNVIEGIGFRYYGGQVQEWADYEDGDGHGTHCAGIIAAVDNDIGVIGTVPRTRIYVAKLFTLDYREIVAAINWAVGKGVQVISISYGTDENFTELKEACDNAYAHGVLLIAAAGSEGKSYLCYPARYDSVVAVGAVYPNGTRRQSSNTGLELEFVAPGVDIYSTWINNGYMNASSTSSASPHVAGVAALIWSSKIDPQYDFDEDGMWDNFEIREKLRHLAFDLGPNGKDNEYGYGLINGWATCQRPLGDINNTLTVDGDDLIIASRAFGSYPTHPKWDPRADITIDNAVDGSDLTIIAKNYGKVDP